MTEDRLLNSLTQHSVDFMLASTSQELPATDTGEGPAIVGHIFIDDQLRNRVELSFALRELNALIEGEEGDFCEIPTDPDWLLLSPAHCVRCGKSTIFLFRSFPGLDDPYEEVKRRAELVIRASGEMHYCMSMEDKLKFMKAFEDGNERE